MKHYIPIQIMICLGLLKPLAYGQDDDYPPLPSGPILVQPFYLQWTVDSKPAPLAPSPNQANDSNTPSQVRYVDPLIIGKKDITRTKDIVVEKIQGKTGTLTMWYQGTFAAIDDDNHPGSNNEFYSEPDTPSIYTAYSRGDFPDLDWITKDCFVRNEMLGSIKCWVFVGKPHLKPYLHETPASVAARTYITTAYVDCSTRLPVKVFDEIQSVDYTYGTPPQQMLFFPQKYLFFLKQMRLLGQGAAVRPSNDFHF